MARRLLNMRLMPVLLISLAAIGCAVEPDPLPQFMQDSPRTDEDVKRAVEEIRRELGEEFIIDNVEGVFYLASNGGVEEYRRCRSTIERMYRFLYKDFLQKKPVKPILVYCFKESDSYEAYCKKAYGRSPSTPFGFYMSGERKMVMNIATGTGTLAHELVHPLVAEDFPTVPSWFNEGFASLYEQSRQTGDGKMEGLVNWRLKGLKEAMSEKRDIALKDLVRTTTQEFYDEPRGVNYATARYLCKWLQDQKKLQDFYREFKSTAKDDATGRKALERTLGTTLDDFEKPWRDWLQALK